MSENKHAPVALPQITKTQVMLALELVPTDMSHQEKCQWIADALNNSDAPAPVALTPAQQHGDELHTVMLALYRACGIWPDLLPRVQHVLAKSLSTGQGKQTAAGRTPAST